MVSNILKIIFVSVSVFIGGISFFITGLKLFSPYGNDAVLSTELMLFNAITFFLVVMSGYLYNPKIKVVFSYLGILVLSLLYGGILEIILIPFGFVIITYFTGYMVYMYYFRSYLFSKNGNNSVV